MTFHFFACVNIFVCKQSIMKLSESPNMIYYLLVLIDKDD